MDIIELNAKAIDLRKSFGEDENSYIDVFALANQIKHLTLLMYPMGEHISGICIKYMNADLIAVNSLMSYGRQRFSLAHELYHLFYDKGVGATISAKSFDNIDKNEKIADKFASYFIAPYNALRFAVNNKCSKPLTLKDIIYLEQSFGLSHKAMIVRLESDGYITKEDAEGFMELGSVQSAAKLYGYDDKLYLPTDSAMQKRTLGNYIIQAEELKKREKISIGKYEELLIDAFRYDIVYGDDESGGIIDD